MRRISPALAAVILIASIAGAADEQGWFGIGVNVDGNGRFWNPVIETITISEITSGSPAADSRLEIGDIIVEIEGEPVAGKRAKALRLHLEGPPGSELRLGLQTPEGELYDLVLISAEKRQEE